MTNTAATTAAQASSRADTAKRAVMACWMLGGILLIGGAAIAGSMLGASGSAGGVATGLIVAGVGQLVVLVAIIATGVRLGVESVSR